jgi:hypothetical protein
VEFVVIYGQESFMREIYIIFILGLKICARDIKLKIRLRILDGMEAS